MEDSGHSGGGDRPFGRSKGRGGGQGGGGRPEYVRQPRISQVKNRAPAPVQITAEQILREAQDRQAAEPKGPLTKIQDADELESYRLRKRKEFEDTVRRVRNNIGAWIKYATWEASQLEFDRARNVWERGLDVDYRNEVMWQKYIEMEMKHKFVNHARNIFDRAVQLQPRVDKFWYKYAHMEEMLGDIDNARQVFERWSKWQPPAEAWTSYIHLELRHRNFANARAVYERFLVAHPYASTYLQYAAFEAKNQTGQGQASARAVYERCPLEIGIENTEPSYFIKFAAFEEKNKELERSRLIFKKGLEHVPKHLAEELYRRYIAFEKQYGDQDGIENVILQKRRVQYEEEVKLNSYNYDIWFDYARLEESNGNADKIRDVYERAISNMPPVATKDAWRRYIYLWINYALYEELTAKLTQDMARTALVYDECLKIIPHKVFTFGKIWLAAAHFQVRQHDLTRARKLLGLALGTCAKRNIFKGYIELELTLGEIDRCRKLYEKMLESFPESCYAWTSFAAMETNLEEVERARAIYELAVQQDVLDEPELLWKHFIDFEIEQGEHSLVRQLYDRLLERTKHVKVWLSRAQFEASLDLDLAREVFRAGDAYFRQTMEQQSSANDSSAIAMGTKEERVLLLEAWRDFEKKYGDAVTLKSVTDRMPRRVKKKRSLTNEDGSDAGWEEFYDYIFPDEAKAQSNLKLLENVRKWKKQKVTEPAVAASSELQ